MKKLGIVSALLLIFVLSECTKAAGPANGKSVQQNNHLDSTVSISADINQVKWQTDSVFGYNITSSGNDSSKVNLEIIATDKSTSSSMIFYITNFTGTHTYIINSPYNSITYYTGSIRHIATFGQIAMKVNKITSGNDTAYSITGTFNFVADTFSVTNGVFDIARP